MSTLNNMLTVCRSKDAEPGKKLQIRQELIHRAWSGDQEVKDLARDVIGNIAGPVCPCQRCNLVRIREVEKQNRKRTALTTKRPVLVKAKPAKSTPPRKLEDLHLGLITIEDVDLHLDAIRQAKTDRVKIYCCIKPSDLATFQRAGWKLFGTKHNYPSPGRSCYELIK